MAVSDRFQKAYRRLTSAFGAHQEAPRDPERVVELAQARADLEDRRNEMRVAREAEELEPFRRENPDWVDPDIGKGATGWVGKILAVVAALVLVAGVVLIGTEVRWSGVGGDVTLSELRFDTEPTADGGCVVKVGGLLVNDSSPIRVVAVNFDAVEGAIGASLESWSGETDRSNVDTGASARVVVAFAVPATEVDPDPCSASRGGVLRVTYAPPTGPLQVVSADL